MGDFKGERIVWVLFLAALFIELAATLSTGVRLPIETMAEGSDLRSYLTAADIVAAGKGASLYDLDIQLSVQRARFPDVHPGTLLAFANPPFVAGALAPLADLRVGTAYRVVLTVNVLLLCVCFGLIAWSRAENEPFPMSLAVLGALSFLPTWTTLWQGQLSLPLLLGVLGAVAAFTRGRDWLGGLCLSLLLLKPQLLPLPVLFLLMQRRWTAVGGVAAGGAATVLVSLAVAGVDGLIAWTRLGELLVGVGDEFGIHPRRMVTLRGALHAILGTDSFTSVRLPWALLSGAAVVILGWRWRWRVQGPAFGLQLGVAVAAGLVLSLHAYPHDLVLMIPAALAFAGPAITTRSLPGRALLVGLLLLVWAFPWTLGTPFPEPAVVPLLVVFISAAALVGTEVLTPPRCSLQNP